MTRGSVTGWEWNERGNARLLLPVVDLNWRWICLPVFLLNKLGVIWKAVNKPFKFLSEKTNKSSGGKGEKMIYSIFPALLVSRCSPFDLATGNDFLKWFLMVFDIIYGTLEQSCNVLNYTKLSELVANKEHQKGPGITGLFWPASASVSFFEGGKFFCFCPFRAHYWK